ncbi:hypothetical protein V6Z12_D02G175100 [Gossypium hirsutum]
MLLVTSVICNSFLVVSTLCVFMFRQGEDRVAIGSPTN